MPHLSFVAIAFWWLIVALYPTNATRHSLQQPLVSQDALANFTESTKRVAIIGAGAAGSSTAYFLRQYADESSIPLDITVYERNPYIGGRSTTVYVHDDILQPVELGASIFVKVNHNLVNAVAAFNLSVDTKEGVDIDAPALGVWDGNEFVLMLNGDEGMSKGWWDLAKLVWKYGLAPYRTLQLTKKVVGSFLKMYEEPYFPFASLSQVAYELGLVEVTAITGKEFLRANGISQEFAGQVIQASTRVNYAQNLDQIHGLETMVCMATDGAMSVEGGNWRIFEGMLNASRADVRLSTAVGLGKKNQDGSWSLSSASSEGETGGVQDFDEIVLAAPMQFANIALPVGVPKHQPDAIPYVDLHVTLFASRHLLSPKAFGLADGGRVPQTVLTTMPTFGDKPEFQSISLLRETTGPTAEREYVYKIFSMQEPTNKFLGDILGLELHESDELQINSSSISWMHRKVWQSYPYEYPRVTFEELKLDDGFWYTSGIESFISTMETSSLMGKNIARLMVNEWLEDKT